MGHEDAAKHRERSRAYYAAHREEVKARTTANRAAKRVPHEWQTEEERKARKRERNQRYYAENREQIQADERARRRPYRKGEHYKSRYGITREDYDRMLEEQGGVCYLCDRPPGKHRLAVDHDHATGAVRGLLCGACNRVLGFIEARPDWPDRARRYLERNHP